MHAFTSLLAFVTMSALAASVSAVPIVFEARQVGNLACDIARLKTVTGLQATSAAVNHIPAASNATVATAVSDAKAGLATSTAGVQTILDALFAGQDAPDDARSQVGDGFTQTLDALQSITSTDTATSKAVKKALGKLQKTIDAGNDVVAQCGSGAGATASSVPSSAPISSASLISSVLTASSAAVTASATSA